jgi:hypothetical protein
MTINSIFPPLTGVEPTRRTLHLYARAVGVVPRAHAPFHPRWWHISLNVQPDGFITDPMPLPDGGSFWLKMDMRRHRVILGTTRGDAQEFDMTQGLSASAFGDSLLDAVAGLGLTAQYAREKYADEEPRRYDSAMAEALFTAFASAERIFNRHRMTLSGEVSPVQLWPHGFDLSTEWFGARMVKVEEGGQVAEHLAQLNLGFSPGEPSHHEPYFYSNPWPFEQDRLVNQPLPHGARWFTQSWQGSLLPYAALVDDPQAEEKLLAYARAVYEITAPTLT